MKERENRTALGEKKPLCGVPPEASRDGLPTVGKASRLTSLAANGGLTFPARNERRHRFREIDIWPVRVGNRENPTSRLAIENENDDENENVGGFSADRSGLSRSFDFSRGLSPTATNEPTNQRM